MKKFIQFFLYFLIILITFLIYNTYLKNDLTKKEEVNKNQDETLIDNENNLIKNLKYEVNFDDNSQYIIKAELSEIIYENNIEIVKMQNVQASIIDKNQDPVIINSERAIYNNSSYNTEFSKNIRIKYMKNTINSGNLDLNFQKNTILIYNNVVYEGLQGEIKADKVEVDLITKNSVISMNNSNKKIEVIAK